MTSGSGDFLVDDKIYPNKAYNDQDVTLVSDTVVTINVSHLVDVLHLWKRGTCIILSGKDPTISPGGLSFDGRWCQSCRSQLQPCQQWC